MNNIRNILLITIITATLVLGTGVVPMQSFAGENKNTKDSKSSIKASTEVDKKSASQHQDQDNFCYRGDDCEQANQGQQIVGKDNDAKGFNDQSKNLQLQAVTPTATPTQPPTQPPTPPTTATLNVCKEVVNAPTTSFQPSDFIFDFTTPASPDLFRGANVGCTEVTVAPGTYSFEEIIPREVQGYMIDFSGSCDEIEFQEIFTGTIAAGETQTCTITNFVSQD